MQLIARTKMQHGPILIFENERWNFFWFVGKNPNGRINNPLRKPNSGAKVAAQTSTFQTQQSSFRKSLILMSRWLSKSSVPPSFVADLIEMTEFIF